MIANLESKDTAMEMLKRACDERGINISYSGLVKNGDIAFKERLRTIFIGSYIDPRNATLFIKKMTEK